MVNWLRKNGALHGRFAKLRNMQNRLSLHRYSYWRDALSYLSQRNIVRVEGNGITLVDDTWEPVRKVSRPKRRRQRTEWFEEHLPEFQERDRVK